jgi:hypothetical protein
VRQTATSPISRALSKNDNTPQPPRSQYLTKRYGKRKNLEIKLFLSPTETFRAVTPPKPIEVRREISIYTNV